MEVSFREVTKKESFSVMPTCICDRQEASGLDTLQEVPAGQRQPVMPRRCMNFLMRDVAGAVPDVEITWELLSKPQ